MPLTRLWELSIFTSVPCRAKKTDLVAGLENGLLNWGEFRVSIDRSSKGELRGVDKRGKVTGYRSRQRVPRVKVTNVIVNGDGI